MNVNLQSRLDRSQILSSKDGITTTESHPSPNTTLRVRVNPDRSLCLLWTKQAMQPLAFNARGLPVDSNSSSTTMPEGNVFFSYCKGMFRHDGVVMFLTSSSQTLSLDHNTLHGTGKRNRMAQFRVHKIDDGRIRMFESLVFRDQFLRIKDGVCDCLGTGDVSCHFRVDIHKDKNFVTLQSVMDHNACIGFDSDGRAIPTEDEGKSNVRLYPEVVQFGIPKKRDQINSDSFKPYSPSPKASPRIPTPTPAFSRPSSVRKEKQPAPLHEEEPPESYLDGDWRLWIHTASTASSSARIILYVYGRNGNSGRILLGSSNAGHLFQAGHRDEFKISLNDLEDIFKIRIELEPESWFDIPPQWTIHEVSMENPNSRSRYNFDFTNRHLSRDSNDMELAREAAVNDCLPLVSYIVTVTTGEVPSAETDSNVFVSLIGDNGDTGRRVLYDRPTVRLFRQGQVDRFMIEAVHLGSLKRCLIGHDDKIGGNGWFCDRITVNDPLTQTDYVFNCQQWLDVDKDDGKIERILRASDPNDDLLQIRRDAQDLIDDVTERAAKRIEDHHAKGDQTIGDPTPRYSTDFEDISPSQTHREPDEEQLEAIKEEASLYGDSRLYNGIFSKAIDHVDGLLEEAKYTPYDGDADDIGGNRHAITPNISNQYQETPRENGVLSRSSLRLGDEFEAQFGAIGQHSVQK